jgi:hypothetical protein
MADRRGRDAGFTDASPESTSSPPIPSPDSPERGRRTSDRAPFTTIPEHTIPTYLTTTQSPADSHGLGIQPHSSSPEEAGARDRSARPPFGSKNITPTTPTTEEQTYHSATTAYDPVATYGLDEEDSPRRYSRRPAAYHSNTDPLHSSTERLTRNIGAESIRSTQSRKSKYDSELMQIRCSNW